MNALTVICSRIVNINVYCKNCISLALRKVERVSVGVPEQCAQFDHWRPLLHFGEMIDIAVFPVIERAWIMFAIVRRRFKSNILIENMIFSQFFTFRDTGAIRTILSGGSALNMESSLCIRCYINSISQVKD